MPGAVVARGIVARQVILAQSLLRRIYRRSNCHWSNIVVGAIVTPYGAFVVGAIIAGAFIVGAIIAGAFIVGAIIAGAIVVGVNFAGAIVAGVNFVGAFVGAIIAEQLSPSAEQLSQEQLSPEHMSDHQFTITLRGPTTVGSFRFDVNGDM